MTLPTLHRRSVVDEAFDLMRSRILHGAWAPGDKLPTEASLTEALGVSRSTVREALNRLASAGLVVIRHGGTKTVADFREHAGLEVLAALVVSPEGKLDVGVVRSVTEMRAAIAPDVARLAAVRGAPAAVAHLEKLANGLDPEASLERLLLDTLDWWTALVLASDNLAYRLAYNTLRNTYGESRPVLRALLADELRAVPLYQSISAAVVARDAEAAAADCVALVALGSTPLFAALDALNGV